MTVLSLIAAGSMGTVSPWVEIRTRDGGGHELRVDGRPFFVEGAGAPVDRFAELARAGANAVRTWGVDEKTGPLLDEAHRHGLRVVVGYWMRKDEGFDYRDPAQRAAQVEQLRGWVRKYRDHPAPLMWAVGNEAELGTPSPEVWIQTEALAAMVKREDPRRPVIAVLADMWDEKLELILRHCPSLDALGINSYDGLPSLHERMRRWPKPYFVTEYHFSQPTRTPQGFVEPSGTEKADSVRENYRRAIQGRPGRVLGSFFFYWNASEVGTAALHTTHLATGEALPVVRVLTERWGGELPANRPPRVRVRRPAPFAVEAPGAVVRLEVEARDPDGDRLRLAYEVLPNDPDRRFQGDFEQRSDPLARGEFERTATVPLPQTPGPYRILVVARDGRGAADVASVSLVVR